jgi:micrococcal nuclease
MHRRRRLAHRFVLLATVTIVTVSCATTAAPRTGAPSAPSGGTVPAPATPVVPSCAPPFPTGVPTADNVRCADPSAMERGHVLRIVDGDTLHVRISGRDETVRLYGINATETGQACSSEATARLRQLAGSDVRLLPDARNRDKYRRLLRYLYTDDGLSIDAEMVAEGLAHAWTSDGALRRAIIALEARATQTHTGCLWR